LEQNVSGSIMSLALLPVISVLSYFFESFAVAESKIGRERELAADRVGLEVPSNRDTASALVKAHAFGDYWESALQRMRETLNQGNTVTNVNPIFCALVSEMSSPSVLVGLGDQRLSHPTDTHPPLNVRLDAIGVTMAEIESAALTTSPEVSAAELIDHYEELETELTKAEQTLMVRNGEVRLNPQIKCPACGRMSPVSADSCACGFNFLDLDDRVPSLVPRKSLNVGSCKIQGLALWTRIIPTFLCFRNSGNVKVVLRGGTGRAKAAPEISRIVMLTAEVKLAVASCAEVRIVEW